MARIDHHNHEALLRRDREVLAQIRPERIEIVRHASIGYSSQRLKRLIREGRGFPEAAEPLTHEEVVATLQVQLSQKARLGAWSRRRSYKTWCEFHTLFGPDRPPGVRLAENRGLQFIQTMKRTFEGYINLTSPLEGFDTFSRQYGMQIGVDFAPIPFDAAGLEAAADMPFLDCIARLPTDWVSSVHGRGIAGLELRCVGLGTKLRPAIVLAAELFYQSEKLDVYRAMILTINNRADPPFYQGAGYLASDSTYEVPTRVFVPFAHRGPANAERYLVRFIRRTRAERAAEIAEENRLREAESEAMDMAALAEWD
jgi:hypothetical protein